MPSLPSRGPLTLPRPTVIKSPEWNPTATVAARFLDGQWIVTIKTRGEGNFRNVSDLYLVMNYTDAAGVAHKVSSPVLPVQIVPTADEGVEFRYSLVQTLRTAHGELNPHILYTDVNTYRNASGGGVGLRYQLHHEG